ncbi:MAG: TIGR04283 family arsenosugar biosynthesis glycosyltransferase [Bryobacterales bacterium]|nr:TIGR04283 family arsenosugar biosynthesis glycosyltransferase [Bryobacterales bacterium]
MISAIVPALNEESGIARTIEALRSLPDPVEVIVVDGGSSDNTVPIAENLGVRVVRSERGRGVQMNLGALAATGEVLWFVHADTTPCAATTAQMLQALSRGPVAGGNFTLVFNGRSPGARLLTFLQPFMKRLGSYYGDSTIFVKRETYFALGGFKPYPLFEDSDLIQRIKRAGEFVSLPATVRTSSRRFEQRGFCLTCLWWSSLQVLYWMGVPAARLERLYGPVRRNSA